ncbi:AbrB/MazE/SpoVT family DNA-binding domain-containing protein [Candidatus Aerophobetes bacterium]|uniref:AbrB/MazE/SpoVT family DNA-binding domain-containing protein n=1 Tax=Aerophobetes bacterium TaxID=2030807 RepID=A0A497E5E5_UNCAE|nr:MAG: AbrB/MazE/SpoVT family DNA-binding domain-containing protein [Candidatus Aerophobetes bacterium]
MAIVTVSTKGQIVIPKEIRESLGLRPGSKIDVKLKENEITLKPVRENMADRLYGKYRGVGLLKDLREEHHRETKREFVRGNQR